MTRTPEIDPTLTQVLLDAIEGRIAEVHTGLPGKVLSFDAAKRVVDVQPELLGAFEDDDGATQIVARPVISNVPVQYPGGGGWSITFPLNVGDPVWLKFAERSLDKWKASPPGEMVDPASTRKHDLSDVVAEPAQLRPTSPTPAVDAVNLRIAHDSGAVVLELALNKVTITAPMIDFAAGGTADQPYVRWTELLTWLASHTHPTAGPGAPSPPTLPPPASIASATIKGR